jgi:hypothetical protein
MSYYTIEFDSTGAISSNKKNVDVNIMGSQNGVHPVEFVILEDYQYDSIKVVWGNFDDDFHREGQVDSIVITNKMATVNVTRTENQKFLRGYLVRYKTTSRQDSVVNFESYSYFEQPFD